MAGGFNGFSEESLFFLARLRDNNEKAWFDAHREELLSYCEGTFRDLLPLHRWLLRLVDDMPRT
jgi:uncharacterized protein (DUF2461 family)